MKKRANTYSSILIWLIALAIGKIGYSQDSLSANSILVRADVLVYENPNLAIQSALKVYNEPSVSAANKINALTIISRSYTALRQNQKALDYILKANELVDETNDAYQKINIYNIIGNQYQQLKIYDKAINYLDKSLALSNSYSEKDSIPKLLAYNYATRGFIYREQLSCEVAITYFDRAITEFKKTLRYKMMNANVSIIYYNRGNCYITLGNYNSAKQDFETSIEYANQVEAKSLIAFAQKGLAEVLTLQGNFTKAIATLNNALEISENAGDLVLHQGLYNAISKNYLAIGDLDNYKNFQQKYTSTQNAIAKNESKTIDRSIVNLAKIAVHKRTKIEQTYFWILVSVSILILLIIFIIIRDFFKFEKKIKRLTQSLK